MEKIALSLLGFVVGYGLFALANRLIAGFSDEQNGLKYSGYVAVCVMSVAAALAWLSLYKWGISIMALAAVAFFYALIVLTIVDIKLQILPDMITLPLILIGVIVNYFGIFTDFKSSIIGALVGFSSLWLVNFIFRIVRKKNGMGAGDFKLFAAIGAWVGWIQLPLVLIFSSFAGLAFVLVTAIITRNKLAARIPFGPYLAAAAIISLSYGNEILGWYLGGIEI